MIYIIGIGPGGSAKYLSKHALEVMQKLDEAIYVGEMIGPEIRGLFSPDKLKVGRFTFEEVYNHLKKAFSSNSNFAILVPGDPSIYSGQDGRERTVGQYIELIKSSHNEFEIIPGVSSWMALCAKAGLDMTDFDSSQAVMVVSLERMVSTSTDKKLDIQSLNKILSNRPSLALFQSFACRKELPKILAQYYNSDSKVIIGYKVSWPDERIIQMTLNDFSKIELDEGLAKHSIILILSRNLTI